MSYSFAQRAPEVKVIAAGGLGDCLLVSPFLRHFKQNAVGRITCITYPNAGQLFDRNPYVDRLILLDERELMLWALPEEGSTVFSPFYTPRVESGEHEMMRLDAVPIDAPNQKGESILVQFGRRAGIDACGFRPEIFTDADDERWADMVVGDSSRACVVLNPDSALPEKNWPDEYWLQLAGALAGCGRVMLLGDDRLHLGAVGVEVIPRPGIRSAAALYRRAACVVTVDSLPGHLAAAVGTRAVVLFGPSNPVVFGHGGNVNLRASACPPCADTARRAACVARTCMQELRPAEVLGHVQAVIGGTGVAQ